MWVSSDKFILLWVASTLRINPGSSIIKSTLDLSTRVVQYIVQLTPLRKPFLTRAYVRWMRSSRVVELLTVNAVVTTVLAIPASSDTVESEGRQTKHCWISYLKKKKIQKNPPLNKVAIGYSIRAVRGTGNTVLLEIHEVKFMTINEQMLQQTALTPHYN